MAEVRLNDGQTLCAVNDFFIGQKTHVSARYRISHNGKGEDQSSSGIIVSTGLGSTGWFASVLTGAAAVVNSFAATKMKMESKGKFGWSSDYLYFSVREPFPSKTSGTSLVCGKITKSSPLVVLSQMSGNGVIFSDGIESDFLPFNSGVEATDRRGAKERKACDRSRAPPARTKKPAALAGSLTEAMAIQRGGESLQPGRQAFQGGRFMVAAASGAVRKDAKGIPIREAGRFLRNRNGQIYGADGRLKPTATCASRPWLEGSPPFPDTSQDVALPYQRTSTPRPDTFTDIAAPPAPPKRASERPTAGAARPSTRPPASGRTTAARS